MNYFIALALLLAAAVDVTAFTGISSRCLQPMAASTTMQPFLLSAEASESSEGGSEEEKERPKLDAFLEKKYPDFYGFVNDDMMKEIKQGSVTLFVPNAAAFKSLGDKKTKQINDPRNLEIREKMGSYHIIAEESVDAMKLRTEDWSKGKPEDGSRPNTMVAGIKTLSGEVPVGRSKSGGFLGWGAKEDGTITNNDCLLFLGNSYSWHFIYVSNFLFLSVVGDIVIGPDAKIVQSFNVEGSFVHEVSHLISPALLWRYCDQLRIL